MKAYLIIFQPIHLIYGNAYQGSPKLPLSKKIYPKRRCTHIWVRSNSLSSQIAMKRKRKVDPNRPLRNKNHFSDSIVFSIAWLPYKTKHQFFPYQRGVKSNSKQQFVCTAVRDNAEGKQCVFMQNGAPSNAYRQRSMTFPKVIIVPASSNQISDRNRSAYTTLSCLPWKESSTLVSKYVTWIIFLGDYFLLWNYLTGVHSKRRFQIGGQDFKLQLPRRVGTLNHSLKSKSVICKAPRFWIYFLGRAISGYCGVHYHTAINNIVRKRSTWISFNMVS